MNIITTQNVTGTLLSQAVIDTESAQSNEQYD
jgi:hypothetical protein